MKHRTYGFSLIELMVALAIFCVVVVLTMTNVSFFDQTILHQEMNTLCCAAHYLQRRAQMTNQEQELVFDRAKRSYTFNGHVHTLPKGIEFGVSPTIKGPPSSPLHAINNPITFQGEKIVFYPQGIMQAGTVYLQHKERNYVCAVSCAVAHVSFLRKYRYDKRWVLMDGSGVKIGKIS